LASIKWLAETAESIKRNPSSPGLFNASAKGARVPGFTEAPLSALVAALPPAPDQIGLAAALPSLPRPNRAEVKADVAQVAGLVNTLRRLAKIDHRKAALEIKNIGQASRFMARLLTPASVAASREERLEALEKADLIMTRMLMSLE
jgi:hypothetical protein